MFAQHSFIEDTHKPILESVIRQNNFVTEKLIARLYGAACNVYGDKNWQAQPSENVSLSRIESTDSVVASSTDMATGFYVQLAGGLQLKTSDKQLTVGRKMVMQGRHPSLGQQATKLW